MDRKKYFLEIFEKAELRYGKSLKRLAGDEWPQDWQTLIATVMSAQTRDEVTIPVSEALFKRYKTLKALSKAKYDDVYAIIRRVNFSRRKAQHVIDAARYVIDNYGGIVPDDIDKLVKIPGVGRKTANLVITEVHNKQGICVDTHVHAICNALGFVKTNSPTQTEYELMKYVPKEHWSRINRLFVLWGKDVPRKTKEKLLKKLEEESDFTK